MGHLFDSGYTRDPFRELCENYPGSEVYPPADFRVEWGPVFHRGRLDGTARVLVIGQDPSAHECVARRILIGPAGQRVQGFLAKLGIDTSYVMVNTFVYCVYGQGGGERHVDDERIVAYRNQWLDAVMADESIEAVIAVGHLADRAFQTWKNTDAARRIEIAYQAIRHPTYPEAAAGSGQADAAEAMREMLAGWNVALQALAAAITHPDTHKALVLYGEALTPENLVPIPETDLPAGLPAWMRSLDPWAARVGETASSKRATITITVPEKQRPWPSS